MAEGRSIDPDYVLRPARWRRRAVAAWLTCFVALALALELVVLAVEIGPFDLAIAWTMGVSTLIAVAAGVGFWRLVARRGNHPRLAVVLLLIAVAWAGLGALTMAWLIAAFNS